MLVIGGSWNVMYDRRFVRSGEELLGWDGWGFAAE